MREGISPGYVRALGLGLAALTMACDGAPDRLRVFDDDEATPAPAAPAVAEPMSALGQALVFDKVLSGDRDVACATCHHPALGTDGDAALSRGVGGRGLGAGARAGCSRRATRRRSSTCTCTRRCTGTAASRAGATGVCGPRPATRSPPRWRRR
jgi:hypothetical protein